MTKKSLVVGKYNLVQVSDFVCEVRSSSGESVVLYASIHEALRKECEWNEDFVLPEKKPSVTFDLRGVETKGMNLFQVMDLCRSGAVPTI